MGSALALVKSGLPTVDVASMASATVMDSTLHVIFNMCNHTITRGKCVRCILLPTLNPDVILLDCVCIQHSLYSLSACHILRTVWHLLYKK